ncbi:MAG: mechanosensitive ion channel [Magnetospirillum sp. WYHS-4]
MESLPEIAALQAQIADFLKLATAWLQKNAFVVGNAIQAAIILVAFLIAKHSARPLAAWAEKAAESAGNYRKAVQIGLWVVTPLMLPVIWLTLQWLSVFVAVYLGFSTGLIRVVVSLLTAWVAIRLLSNVVGNPAWSKFIAVTVWTVAALNSVGWLTPVAKFLDSLAVEMGDVRLSLLAAIKAVVSLAVFLWLAGAVTHLMEGKIGKVAGLSPSAQALFGKLSKMVLYTLAVVVGLKTVGIDLTAFAVFTGAVGLGIGFGLQKVFSNLISGIILLIDKSVKPGDVIAIGSTYGIISSLGARYVSVSTQEGKEHLIPNEELISHRVESWSHSNRLVRVDVPFAISYSSDLRKAMDLALAATRSEPRILTAPEPTCRLRAFAEKGIDMELGFWINDPQNGLGSVRSAVMLRLWDQFREHGVYFPATVPAAPSSVNVRLVDGGPAVIP